VAIIGNDAGHFRQALQCREMSAGVMIDHLDTISDRMRHEDAARLRVKDFRGRKKCRQNQVCR
jgi:hypothetical protein